jgi:aspartokinase
VEAVSLPSSFARAPKCRFTEAIAAGRISDVEAITDCCVLAAVGQQMASRKGVSATLFGALAKANINIRCAARVLGTWRASGVQVSAHLPLVVACMACWPRPTATSGALQCMGRAAAVGCM